MSEIKLGDKVEYIHSGFQGVVIEKTTHINQCVQFAVLPKADKENEMPEPVGIDEQNLKTIGRKKSFEVKPFEVDENIELGDIVKCKNSGFIGTITSINEHISGNISHNILPRIGKDKKMPEEVCLNQQNLKIIKKKIRPVVKKEPKTRTGGAMNRNLTNRRGF